MAASAEPLSGSLYRLKISDDGGTTWVVVALCTNLSLSNTQGERITNTRDDLGWETSVPNFRKSVTLSGEALINFAVESGKHKYNNLWDLWEASTLFDFYIEPYDIQAGAAVAGEYNWQGRGRISELPAEFPLDENATFSFSIKATGAVTHEIES